jgi:hypothetical protein
MIYILKQLIKVFICIELYYNIYIIYIHLIVITLIIVIKAITAY